MQIKDQAKADEAVQEALSLLPEASVTESEGVRYISFPSLQSPFANPTLAMIDGFLVLGVSSEELSQAMQSIKSGQTLDKVPAFAAAETAYRTANEVFGYVDTKRLVERSYPNYAKSSSLARRSCRASATSSMALSCLKLRLSPGIFSQSSTDKLVSRKAISLSQAGRSR